ncbi:uncharacterized protein L969DRAFT_93650 [Mixia osmundae IAM 14324]|uniref:Chromatin modification-related protein n=1 Tax=Mixia osmundae (strain CBS 9802 / IAM 14324 / JCM 22182 / KY 12970) TaxID=764103 RepID=G7E969_MIXOS|nr:uncharacterized protein L969DRAFT_93650 [Mixia osmundae IAM 14324]KEI39809.1 hypothetical protein L969DRAFT_93650 [Mixia osmundae IAM 14324]GAA99188.1 hypothetical protein E5Q_05880 [Mixia osmundae IAM 14324]
MSSRRRHMRDAEDELYDGQGLPHVTPEENNAAEFAHLVLTACDTVDSLPHSLTRSLSDLKELDAVLSSALLQITGKLQTLLAMMEDPTVRPSTRLTLLWEIAEEARGFKLGGEDKIRVATGTCDTVDHHTQQLDMIAALLAQHLPGRVFAERPSSSTPHGYPGLFPAYCNGSTERFRQEAVPPGAQMQYLSQAGGSAYSSAPRTTGYTIPYASRGAAQPTSQYDQRTALPAPRHAGQSSRHGGPALTKQRDPPASRTALYPDIYAQDQMSSHVQRQSNSESKDQRIHHNQYTKRREREQHLGGSNIYGAPGEPLSPHIAADYDMQGEVYARPGAAAATNGGSRKTSNGTSGNGRTISPKKPRRPTASQAYCEYGIAHSPTSTTSSVNAVTKSGRATGKEKRASPSFERPSGSQGATKRGRGKKPSYENGEARSPANSTNSAYIPASRPGPKRKAPSAAVTRDLIDAQLYDIAPAPEADAAGQADDGAYCLCGQGSYGEMVGCDGDECEREWFHLACLGMKEAPRGRWLCPDCSIKQGEPAAKKKRRN